MSKNNIKINEIIFDNSILMPEIVRMLKNGHTVTLRLKGTSMRPFIEGTRDKAILKSPSSPKVSDPVLAEINNGIYVLHRIIDINGEDVILQGDGNIFVEHCRMNDIKGLAIGFYRKGRKNKIDYIYSRKWKIYSYIWIRMLPIRKYLLAFYRIIWLKVFPIE
ncbi:S24/S26 family peptidase [Xylanibacter oryzae]|uniref:S24/S26 family peptidase n=1 Tax=Xylanibacter oryzae TaxID=185293 RepID=UPI0004BBB095|nr:S24/S26 family peptidase [Xylanibacter oryzae]